jgi:hypothetical protein
MAKSAAQKLPSVINMGRPKGSKKIEVVENLVPLSAVDNAYALKGDLEVVEAAFKDTAEKLKNRAATYLGGPGACTLPGTDVDAQVVVRHAILGVTNPEMAKAVAGADFYRYIDEQIESVMYTVTNLPVVMGALKACGIDPDTVLQRTTKATYAVRQQYQTDVADGTLERLLGKKKSEALRDCIEVVSRENTSLKFIERK